MLPEDWIAKYIWADFVRKQKLPSLERGGIYFMVFTFDTWSSLIWL